jgi:hypothetical protein
MLDRARKTGRKSRHTPSALIVDYVIFGNILIYIDSNLGGGSCGFAKKADAG